MSTPVDELDESRERPGADDAPSPWASVLRSGGARLFVLPVSAILGVVNTRLIIGHYGTEAYAQYGLLVAMGALFPFADLGMSAAIMNSVAESEDPASDDRVRRALLTSVRVLICSAGVIVLVVLGVSVAGLWPTILGDGLLEGSGGRTAAACMVVFGLTLPAGFGQRILTGLDRNHLRVAVLGLQTPIVLVVLATFVLLDLDVGGYLAVVPYVVTFGLTVAMAVVAARMIRPAVGWALRAVAKVRTVRGAKVLDVAWPMLVQMVALPIAMQTDRLVLSHVAGSDELARYNLGAQIYLPVWQVASAAGVALWPVFARARARGEAAVSPMRMSVAFGGIAAGACLLLAVASPVLVRLASDDRIDLSPGLILAFSAFMVVQAAKYPLGMYMTDARGLRYQAVMIVVMVPANLGISVVLAGELGAVGPVIGSLVGVLTLQLVANWHYVRKRIQEGQGAGA